MKKLLFLLLIGFSSTAFSQLTTMDLDLEVKGNLKSLRNISYRITDKGAKQATDSLGDNYFILFKSPGKKERSESYDKNGKIVTIETYSYNAQGKETQAILMNNKNEPSKKPS